MALVEAVLEIIGSVTPDGGVSRMRSQSGTAMQGLRNKWQGSYGWVCCHEKTMPVRALSDGRRAAQAPSMQRAATALRIDMKGTTKEDEDGEVPAMVFIDEIIGDREVVVKVLVQKHRNPFEVIDELEHSRMFLFRGTQDDIGRKEAMFSNLFTVGCNMCALSPCFVPLVDWSIAAMGEYALTMLSMPRLDESLEDFLVRDFSDVQAVLFYLLEIGDKTTQMKATHRDRHMGNSLFITLPPGADRVVHLFLDPGGVTFRVRKPWIVMSIDFSLAEAGVSAIEDGQWAARRPPWKPSDRPWHVSGAAPSRSSSEKKRFMSFHCADSLCAMHACSFVEGRLQEGAHVPVSAFARRHDRPDIGTLVRMFPFAPVGKADPRAAGAPRRAKMYEHVPEMILDACVLTEGVVSEQADLEWLLYCVRAISGENADFQCMPGPGRMNDILKRGGGEHRVRAFARQIEHEIMRCSIEDSLRCPGRSSLNAFQRLKRSAMFHELRARPSTLPRGQDRWVCWHNATESGLDG